MKIITPSTISSYIPNDNGIVLTGIKESLNATLLSYSVKNAFEKTYSESTPQYKVRNSNGSINTLGENYFGINDKINSQFKTETEATLNNFHYYLPYLQSENILYTEKNNIISSFAKDFGLYNQNFMSNVNRDSSTGIKNLIIADGRIETHPLILLVDMSDIYNEDLYCPNINDTSDIRYYLQGTTVINGETTITYSSYLIDNLNATTFNEIKDKVYVKINDNFVKVGNILSALEPKLCLVARCFPIPMDCFKISTKIYAFRYPEWILNDTSILNSLEKQIIVYSPTEFLNLIQFKSYSENTFGTTGIVADKSTKLSNLNTIETVLLNRTENEIPTSIVVG